VLIWLNFDVRVPFVLGLVRHAAKIVVFSAFELLADQVTHQGQGVVDTLCIVVVGLGLPR
jgi:hypothetical protein